MIERGFYTIKDEFFVEFNDRYLKGNKSEKRPHYYAFRDNSTGLFWVIPMSSRVDKYRRIIENRESQNKPCDILHIVKLDNDRVNVFLIQDMFPITENYIQREYTIAENHLKLTSDAQASIVNKKAKKVLNMIKKGIKLNPTQPDVMKIEKALLNK